MIRSFKFGLTLVLLATLGCGQRLQTAELEATLSHLSLNEPTADLERNLRAGDTRFVGINGVACEAPGLPDDCRTIALMNRYGLHCLEGTSDGVEGARHEALIQKATNYAKTYNTELLRRIQAESVPAAIPSLPEADVLVRARAALSKIGQDPALVTFSKPEFHGAMLQRPELKGATHVWWVFASPKPTCSRQSDGTLDCIAPIDGDYLVLVDDNSEASCAQQAIAPLPCK